MGVGLLQQSKIPLDRSSLAFGWIMLIVGSLGTILVWIFAQQIANDFSAFWRTANGTMESVYAPQGTSPFPYPPTALPFVSPLALLPKWPAFAIWSVLSVFALWAAVRPALGKWPFILLMLSPPVTNGLWNGQSTMLLTAAILWGLRSERHLLAGVAFGVVATIKPQLVLFLPLLLLIRRDWKGIAGATLAVIALLSITTVLYGVDVWREWLGALPRFRQTIYDLKINSLVITVPGFAERMGLSMVPFILIGLAFGALLVWRSAKKDFIEAGAAVAIASFFVAPYALGYDLILAAPYLVRQIFRRDILPTIALAIAPNPLPVILGAASLLGAKVDLALLTAGVRRPATD